MTDLLRQGSAWLEQQRAAHCSSQVEYRRGSEKYPLVATYGKTDYEIATAGEMTVGGHVWDFLILATDLGFEPQPGDIIVADEQTHEVMPIGDDVDGWRWSDPYRQTYRIHTRETGAV